VFTHGKTAGLPHWITEGVRRRPVRRCFASLLNIVRFHPPSFRREGMVRETVNLGERLCGAMTPLPRFNQVLLVCCISIVALSPSVYAQGSQGTIFGRITSDSGQALAAAQVSLLGTSFHSVSDDSGRYLLHEIPAGTYTLRVQRIGYAVTNLEGLRVIAGQRNRADLSLKSSAVILGAIDVQEATNPLVPPDELQSRSIVSGSLVDSLPTDNVRAAIALQPGVVESGRSEGVSIRGGRPGQAAVYIDGVPVRSASTGGQLIDVQTNALEGISVTTGALGAEYGEAQSGVIAYTTKSGGQRLAGSWYSATDGLTGSVISTGYNRLGGSVGGPLGRSQALRFYFSGLVQGQTSPFRQSGAGEVTNYVIAGVDTTVTAPTGNGSQSVVIPKFVRYSGTCDPSRNDGYACQGIRLPMAWNTTINLQGKVTYSYGASSSLQLTGVASGQQLRNYPGTLIFNPAEYTGEHHWSRLYIATWTQTLREEPIRALSVTANLSYLSDEDLVGPLDPTTDITTRSPLGGFDFTPLVFGGFGSFARDFLADPDAIIRNIRTDAGERLPAGPFTIGAQPYRMNPYGSSSGGWITQGNDATGTLHEESRVRAEGQVQWQAGPFQRFSAGASWEVNDIAHWAGDFLTERLGLLAYHARPVVGGGWVTDRGNLGDAIVEIGVRYDVFNSRALFPIIPGFIQSANGWNLRAATSDTAYQGSVGRVFAHGVSHGALSPRLGLSFPIDTATDIRLSYAHQLQMPDFNTVLQGLNSDINVTGPAAFYGRDVGFGRTILFEIGIRHAVSQALVLDAAVYNKAFSSELSFRQLTFPDPDPLAPSHLLNALTTADYGYARGLDLKVDFREQPWIAGSVAYSFEVSQSTGSDPYSYLDHVGAGLIAQNGNPIPLPANQLRDVDDERRHNFAGLMILTVPVDWRAGTTTGRILDGASAVIVLRAISGLPYTPVKAGFLTTRAPFTSISGLNAVADVNSATTPWETYLDARVNKLFQLGRMHVTIFADLRNLIQGLTGVFAVTGSTVDTVSANDFASQELTRIANEANLNGALRSDGAVILGSCGTWGASEGVTGAVNCVELGRTEARFGNGDGVFTPAEQRRAMQAQYDQFNGPWTFNSLALNVRFGLEITF
jgi:outer membrane receptor protein involved in Fe transport